MTGLLAILTQHPVGQGGLMSGLLELPGGRFHWVYDCGSNQHDALKREVAAVAARGQIDCLFLSHLDSDHVNGIDLLLGASSVKEVVLPYLNNIDRFLAAARDAANGSLTGSFTAMLADIPGWFDQRGVQRVTFITPRSDDEGGEGPGADLPGGGEGDVREGNIRAKWTRKDKSTAVLTGRAARQGKIATHELANGASLCFEAGHAMLDWVLSPYAHRPDKNRMAAFLEAFRDAFGQCVLNDDFWLDAVKDGAKRETLRACYDVVWSDHNLVSMALYAGPARSSGWRAECESDYPWWHNWHSDRAAGWLGTGDMHLDVAIRRNAFLRHYDRLLPLVNVFGLPHHGSHLNFHVSLPSAMPNALHFVAASGPNSYGHPSPLVKEQVSGSGRQFVRVSHRANRALVWRCFL